MMSSELEKIEYKVWMKFGKFEFYLFVKYFKESKMSQVKSS